MDRGARLAGKVAIVVGASSGFGRAAADLFALNGAAVVLAARRADLLQDAVERIRSSGGEAVAIGTDVLLEADLDRLVAQAFERFGGLDIMFNNAGTQLFKNADETTAEEWDRVLGVNLRGTWLGCKHAIPVMRRNGGGAIINTSSIYATAGVPAQAAYAASKGAVLSLTRQLAIELAPARIRVNCLCPGWIDTEYARNWFAGQSDPDAAWQATLAAYPLGRPGEPVEAAQAALFLASDEASFVTGQALYVDGGYTAQ
jgi:NAD(P)-dependent dehydrogenase (short-subunit alcohol dehydrogenase family)